MFGKNNKYGNNTCFFLNRQYNKRGDSSHISSCYLTNLSDPLVISIYSLYTESLSKSFCAESHSNLIKAGDYLPFPDIPDERSITRRRPCYAVQVSFKTHTKVSYFHMKTDDTLLLGWD